MATGVVSWSQTAASNASADSSVNFAEGMAPSAVNDSARALMASVAKWRDDLNGSITTAGTSTAYTVTSNQGLALTAGYVVAFVPHTTNGATVTINVDSLGAKPLRSAPGVELPAGVLVQGTPYAATYATTNSGEWILHGVYGPTFGAPIGGGMIYVGTTAPNASFAFPYGQAISRTTYATLFGVCGTAFGSGDGSTTFNLPDVRGRTIIGKDDMGGVAASRVTSAGSGINGTTMGAAGGAETVTVAQANLPSVSLSTTITDTRTFKMFGGTSTTHDHSGSTGPTYDGVNAGTATADLHISTWTNGGTISGSTPLGGSGTALNKMPPAIVIPWIIRII